MWHRFVLSHSVAVAKALGLRPVSVPPPKGTLSERTAESAYTEGHQFIVETVCFVQQRSWF